MLALCCVLTRTCRRPSHSAQRPGTDQRAGHNWPPVMKLTALAKKQQWQDYRYTFNVYIPSTVSTSALCATVPQVTSSTSPEEWP
ncbi:flagellar P-ring addition protein [Citrobacter braakii]|nr:flagellar P-ring addition protein [Citrobacter braakii]